MKYLILLFITSTLFSNELEWVSDQVSSILPNRVGIDKKQLSEIKDPFISLVKKKKSTNNKLGSSKSIKKYKKRKVYLRVAAIMNNSALINGKWFKVGRYINGYKISSIENSFVLLQKDGRSLKLTTQSKKTTLKISK